MKIVVFTGPSLSADEARTVLDATYLPPAAEGDVLRAAMGRPDAIGLVDGSIDAAPALAQEEILWAMAEGIHVFGAGGVGALRAAELARLGMIGVGAIYEAFARCDLEDDDEVAFVHAGPEHGHRAISEAMVDIRATLARAVSERVIGEATRAALERLAKDRSYEDRCYPLLVAEALERELPVREINALRVWLPKGRVRRTREDAISMLRVMKVELSRKPGPKEVVYGFEHTDGWEDLRSRALGAGPALPA